MIDNDKKQQNSKVGKSPVVKKDNKLTVRQFFYSEKQYKEDLIKSLERTHKECKKTIEEWVEIMSFKGIVF